MSHRFAIAAALVASLTGAFDAWAQPHPRIVNGAPTGDFPEVGIVLQHASRTDDTIVSLCSGTLVGCRTLLTAAHCVCAFSSDDAASCLAQGMVHPDELTVFLANAGRIAVDGIQIHPEYDFTRRGDFAVLRLAESVATIEPAILDVAGRVAIGTAATIVGYGNTGGPPADQNDFGIKRVGSVRTGACSTTVSADNHICWDFVDVDSNTCGGDSGGPLFVERLGSPRLAGVTSGGNNSSCLAPDNGFDADVFVHLDWLLPAIAASEGAIPCPEGPVLGDAELVASTVEGTLERSDAEAVIPVPVPPDAAALLVTLNGALYSNGRFSTPNEFSLSLRPPGAAQAACIDASLGPFDVCRIDAPVAGTWQARIGRLRGFGAFQLSTTTHLAAARPCPGDCDGDGEVGVDELLRTVMLLFDSRLIASCAAADADASLGVSAGELLLALRSALDGCAP